MGVTIHYRGTLDDLGKIDDLCRELADIGKSGSSAAKPLQRVVI